MQKSRDHIVSAAREFARRSLRGAQRTVRGPDAVEERQYVTHLDRVAELLTSVGYGPRVVAAAYLHSDRLNPERLLSNSLFDADVASLVFWARDGNSHLPSGIRDAMLQSKLRRAPQAAKAIVCASRISNLESIERLSHSEIQAGMLTRCGYEPLEAPIRERAAALRRLLQIFEDSVPLTLLQLLSERLSRLEQTAAELELFFVSEELSCGLLEMGGDLLSSEHRSDMANPFGVVE